jgi:hypothetical protein
MGRPRHRPSSCDAWDEGWSLPLVLSPLVQRDWRRHRAKGDVFAFAPTISSLETNINQLLKPMLIAAMNEASVFENDVSYHSESIL